MADRTYLEWPFFDDSHRRLADELERWCAAELGDEEPADVDAACRDLVARLGAAGWLRYCVPAAHGGVHDTLDVRSLALIRETLARHDGLADFAFAMQGLGSGTISLFGSDEQKNHYLPGVASGQLVAAFALSEPDAGSDVAGLETIFWPDREGVNVRGTKTFISNGGIADFYVVFAREEGSAGSKGISAFVLDAPTPGLDATERIEVIAPHPLATLRLDTYASHSALIGEQGRGFAQAMATLDVFRTTVGAAALGFARRALDEATKRALERKLGSATLADNPITQSKLAEMVLDVETSALLVYRAAWLRDVKGQRNSREAALAKLHATDSAQQVIDKAVQIFGGLGVTRGVPVERLYREIRALRIYEGASEVQKVVIARHHLAEKPAMKALLPPGWPRPKGYSNAVSARGRIIVTAGLVGWDEQEKFVAADLAGQFRQILGNLLLILAEDEAGPEHIVRMTWYVTDVAEYRAGLKEIGSAWRELIGKHFPAMAVVQVGALVEPQAKIEIETMAIIPEA